jgi:N-acetylneuraminate synthase
MVEAATDSGCKDLIILHCISSYPAPVEQSNLRTIPDLQKRFGTQVGLSDHTTNNTTSIAATTLGATVIEKHFILDRNDKGPDSSFSIMPDELEMLCKETNEAWSSLGHAGYERKQSEEGNVKFRRSVYFVKALEAGDIITTDSVRRIRPGYGLPPKFESDIIGRRLKKSVTIGTATSWDLIDN